MRKRAEIKAGSEVSWKASIRPELDYMALIDAKVVQVYPESDLGEAIAAIAVAKDRTITAPIVHFEVPLSELESKTWIEDVERTAQIERDRFEKATIVDPHGCEAVIAPDGEKVYNDIEDYLEECEDNEVEPSPYLWCVNLVDPEKLSADAFADHWYEQVGEDYTNDLKGVDELQGAINAFYAANAGMKLCETDYTRAVQMVKS